GGGGEGARGAGGRGGEGGGGGMGRVTDGIAAAHAGDGSYSLAGVDFEVEDGVARNADQVLAGSTVCMIDAVRNLVALGAPLEAALSAASALPARIAGRPELGTLAPGTVADGVGPDDGPGGHAGRRHGGRT